MTVIVWDGYTLAADKRCVYGGMINTVTKIWRVGDQLIGGAGEFGLVEEMKCWIEAGAKPAEFPAPQRTDGWAAMIAIDANGARLYEKTPMPIRYDQGMPVTLGSGRDFARAVLHLGHDAVYAVEVASALCNSCGNGVDVLTLEAAGPGLTASEAAAIRRAAINSYELQGPIR